MSLYNVDQILSLRSSLHEQLKSITEEEYREINTFLYHYGDTRYDEYLMKNVHKIWTETMKIQSSPFFTKSLLEYIGIQLKPSILIKMIRFYHLFKELEREIIKRILNGQSIQEEEENPEDRISFFEEEEIEKILTESVYTIGIPLNRKKAGSGDEILDMDNNKYDIIDRKDWITYTHPHFRQHFTYLFLCEWKINVEHPYELRTIPPPEEKREYVLTIKDNIELLIQCFFCFDMPY